MSEEDIPLFIYKGGGGVPEDVTNVEFHSSVNEVAGRAFSCCRNLKEVLLNEGMQKIGEEAFSFCRSLEIVKFAHCRGLVRLGHHYPQLLRFWEVPQAWAVPADKQDRLGNILGPARDRQIAGIEGDDDKYAVVSEHLSEGQKATRQKADSI